MRQFQYRGLLRLTFLLSVLLGATAARSDGARAFDIALIYRKSPAQVQAALKRVKGVCRSVGHQNSFVEYSLPSASVFVLFSKGESTQITVTLRSPVPRPEALLRMAGLNAKGRKADQQDLLMRRWNNLGGVKEVTIKSGDGRTWETAEFRAQPTRTP